VDHAGLGDRGRAVDALRVLAGFLELHAADPIAQAITTHLTRPPAEPGG
jgi:hypothetical protein